jgi:hypothetical protein
MEATTLERTTISTLKTWMCINRQDLQSFSQTRRTTSFGQTLYLCSCSSHKVSTQETCFCKAPMRLLLPQCKTLRRQLSSHPSTSNPSSIRERRLVQVAKEPQPGRPLLRLQVSSQQILKIREVFWLQRPRQQRWIQWSPPRKRPRP